MVRVISVHHFASQNVQTVEQPTACTVAPPDRLLLALTSNCIEVRDLKNESEVQFTFPTVDEAIQIVHCLNGDYVASLETKYNRQNRETNFVRVYINWDSVATLQQSKMTSSNISLGSSECGMVQPMRARIAGRVTPTTNQSELGSLEMIEIPVRRNPNSIACCQVSGNLAILSNRLINFYKFRVCTHDISKLKFIDFEELPFMIELGFLPFEIQFCENYVAAMGRDTMHLFRVLTENGTDLLSKTATVNDFTFLYSKEEPIDFAQLVREEKSKRQKITVNLPGIVKENSLVHKHSPFTFTDKQLKAFIKPSSSLENKTHMYKLQDLIQLKLVPILIENNQRQVSEEFKSMVLKPLYIDEHFNKKSDQADFADLRSDFRTNLNSVACMIATQQEGYLHFFSDTDISLDKDNCIAVYPFTSPVFKIVMEDYFLHALTETGLESYTLRIGHQLCRNLYHMNSNQVAIPSIEDSICLVGLRPFLGVEKILLSDNFLVLLANSDSSPAHSVSSSGSSTAIFLTLYTLELPSPKVVFNDISIVADVHRFTSAQTYCHLISEAHMVLRLGLMLKKWSIADDFNVKLIMEKRTSNEDLVETYRLSCALLGDHYMMCSNESSYALAIPYYKMALVNPLDVLKRVKKLQDQSRSKMTKGLMNYVKHTLLDIKTSYDVDKYFGTGSKDCFLKTMLDLLESQGYSELPGLLLKSRILRDYSTESLIYLLENRCSDATNLSEQHLALTILYLQEYNDHKAEQHLRYMTGENLTDLLLDNWEVLFDITHLPHRRNKTTMSFSQLGSFLISRCPEVLADILVVLISERKVIGLNKLIKVFLEYLPSSIGYDSDFARTVLQTTLEAFFTRFFSKPENLDVSKVVYEKGATDAIKLLVRTYLAQMEVLQMKAEAQEEVSVCKSTSPDEFEETDSDLEKLQYDRIYKTYFDESSKTSKSQGKYLFSTLRYEYLDKMPPFQVSIAAKMYEICVDGYVSEPCLDIPEADTVLKKLQALLCSKLVPEEVVSEVNEFLTVNKKLRGSHSLKSITMNTNDAVLLLINVCPQCLLQFAKDRFTKEEEWKFLVATVQRKILKLSQKESLHRVCFFHKKILKDILTYAAANFTMEQLKLVFPQRFSTDDECEKRPLEGAIVAILDEIQDYEPYVSMCKNSQKANDVNKMLTSKAQQLLNNLNF